LSHRPTWDEFYSLQRFGIHPDLDNIQRFCRRLGHPVRAFPSVHVAGTNGKGSTVALLDSILRRAGLTVGRYTSPHILRFEERILVGGEMIPEAAVFDFLQEHWDFIREHGLTFFETATAMALDYFRHRQVDVAVVEVGLGGTWDATRVVQSLVSVVTRIDYDHTDRLGSTLEEIAGDKAGIFRPDRPAVSFRQRPEVLAVLKSKAQQTGASFFLAEDLVALSSLELSPERTTGAASLTHTHPPIHLRSWECPLVGSYQVENIMLALAAGELLREHFPTIDERAIKAGLSGVSWPGRLQVLRRRPWVVVDVGHNPGAVRETLRNARELWRPRRLLAVFSALKDKDVAGMLAGLRDGADLTILAPLPPPRGLTLADLEAQARQVDWTPRSAGSVAEALRLALDLADSEDLILALGSHLVAEEAQKMQIIS